MVFPGECADLNVGTWQSHSFSYEVPVICNVYDTASTRTY